MTNYSAVAGATEESFNHLSAQLYRAIYPKAPFRGEIQVDDPIKLKAVYDVKEAFRFRLRNSELVAGYAAEYKAQLLAARTSFQAAEAAPSPQDVDRLVDHAVDTRASFDILAERCALKVSVQDRPEREFEAALTLGVVARFDTDWKLVPQVLTATVKLLGRTDPELEELLNKYLIPLMLPQLNEFLAKGFELPPLQFEGVEFAAPQVRVQDGVIAGYAALRGQTTQAPERIAVRNKKGVFVHFDDAVANGTAAGILRHTQQSGKAWGREAEAGFGIEACARYSVGLRKPNFVLQVDNRTEASLEAYGSGRAQFRVQALGFWGPWVGAGLSISAQPQVVASVLLSEGWVRFHDFRLTRPLDVKLTFDGLPNFINDLLSKIIGALLTPIVALITGLIAALKIPVFKLPEVATEIGGVPIKIQLEQTVIDTLEADGRRLCEVAGVVVAIGRQNRDASEVAA